MQFKCTKHRWDGSGNSSYVIYFNTTNIRLILTHFNKNNRSNRKTYTSQCTLCRHKLHLLKKSGANRKQAYADREEFTDRKASYMREKKRVMFLIYAKCAPTGSTEAVCMVAGGVDGSASPHLSEALHRALRQFWTGNGSLWPALNGTRTRTY